MTIRYAIYYAPEPSSLLAQAGCRWLGRDAMNSGFVEQLAVPGVPAAVFHRLTWDARRYGFHATMKAPFRLAGGWSETALLKRAEEFAGSTIRFALPKLETDISKGFLALHCGFDNAADTRLSALAQQCVEVFDDLRAPMGDAERARRLSSPLSERQMQLLERWGYPYTEDAFRFHMTLSDRLRSIDRPTRDLLRQGASQVFDAVFAVEPVVFDAITIFREEATGAAFKAWRRFDFAKKNAYS